MIPFRPHHSWWVQLLLAFWRWTPELLLIGFTLWYWHRTAVGGWPGWVQLTLPAVILAGLLAWSRSRRWVLGLFWLLVTRHRLRQYFLQCGAYNRSGRLPWLTLSYPTPVGERVWVWLVAGLSLADFESGTQQIAVACWARDCRVGRSKRLAGLVWVDVIRRDPLTGSQPHTSPLLTSTEPAPASSSTQLDEQATVILGEVVAEASTPAPAAARAARQDGPLDVSRTVIDLDALRPDPAASNGTNGNGNGRKNGKPAAKRTTAEEAVVPTPAVSVTHGGEDVSDWI